MMRKLSVFQVLGTSWFIFWASTALVSADGPKNRPNPLIELKQTDQCGTLYMSKKHGYQVKEYEIETIDKYKLNIHRLIHPSDMENGGPTVNMKKPYLLVHGLVGTSASFLRNINDDYSAPSNTFDVHSAVHDILAHKVNHYATNWQSTADKFRAAYKGDKSASFDSLSLRQKLLKTEPEKLFASLEEVDYGGDALTFAREYKQAYMKFEMPIDSMDYITNSLAMTMSNFGYDVWLINLRGNHYSRKYNGPLNANDETSEYWKFGIEQVVREDLLASINFVKRTSKYSWPIGLIAYSYSNLHVLNLLTKFPEYQKEVQPIVMVAPIAPLGSGKHATLHKLMSLGSKVVISKNGPFPSLGRGDEKISLEKVVCNVPVASKLCRFIEIVLHGKPKSVKQIIFDDKTTALAKKDLSCGQTSKATLHEIFKFMAQNKMPPEFVPFVKARDFEEHHGNPIRRSMILVHSLDDQVGSPESVSNIKGRSLKHMTLVDYMIGEPNFDHTDFLFSKRNQYLVNGEIVRLTALYDVMMTRPSANSIIRRATGY